VNHRDDEHAGHRRHGRGVALIILIVRRVARAQPSAGARPEGLDVLEPESAEVSPERNEDTQYYLTQANVLAGEGLIGEDIGEGGPDSSKPSLFLTFF
jgi:hypothetical protein